MDLKIIMSIFRVFHLQAIAILLLSFGIQKINTGTDHILQDSADNRLPGYVTDDMEDLDFECHTSDYEPNDVVMADQLRTCGRRKRDVAGGGTANQPQNKSEARLLFEAFKPADPSDFIELQGENEIYHQLRPDGYATYPRTKMLPFFPKDSSDIYPPFSYHGLYGPKSWHQIPWENFLRLKNRSFMLLKHKCEDISQSNTPGSASTGAASGGGGGGSSDLTEMVVCQHEEIPRLPKCDSNFQSPINIIRDRARQSVLLADYTYRNFDQKLEFLMSLPWDGTSLLTVEILNAEKNPEDSLTFYSNTNQLNRSQFGGGGGSASSTSASSIPTTTQIGMAPQISVGPLAGTELYLDRIHIKYGATVHEGSEHQLDGKSFAMELQFMFTKDGRQFITPYWDTLMMYYTAEVQGGESVESLYGKHVHIVSVFVEVMDNIDSNDKWAVEAAEEFKKLSAAAKHFWNVNNRPVNYSQLPGSFKDLPLRARGFKTMTETSKIILKKLIPPKEVVDGKVRSSPYYTYQGSLTHPPCFEYINYGVYEKPIQITKEMWTGFLFIPSEFDDTRYLAGNYRPVKSIYNLATDLKIQKDREKVEAAFNLINSRPVRKSKPRFDDENWPDAETFDYFGGDPASDLPHIKTLLLVLILLALSL